MRACLLFLLLSAVAFASTFRLYLKSGDYQIVREYQIQGDRVHYYSTERGEWEDIPTTLVDFDRTKKEQQAISEASQEEAKQDEEERQARLELKREIASVPQDNGAYIKVDDKLETLQAAQCQVATNKSRKVLAVMTPVPLIPGKATVVVAGEHAKFAVHDARPAFYFRPERQESFGIVRLTPRKGHRIVENISIVPRVNVASQSRDEVPVFQQELAENLYKVWPEKPLSPGEYAVIEYDDDALTTNDIELLVWDFAYQQ